MREDIMKTKYPEMYEEIFVNQFAVARTKITHYANHKSLKDISILCK
jgi:hypothetical protein